MSFFQSCPHEILLPIFSHCILELKHPCQQLSSLERTCKQFRRIILDSSVWRTLHTNLFGNTLNSQAASTIDWKAQCKKNIVLLRGIQSSLNNKSNGNERVLRNCAVTLKELWKLVRSMNGRKSELFEQFGVTKAVIQFLLQAAEPGLPIQYTLSPRFSESLVSSLNDGYKALSMILATDGVNLESFYPHHVYESIEELCYYFHDDRGETFVLELGLESFHFSLGCRMHAYMLWLISYFGHRLPDLFPESLPFLPGKATYLACIDALSLANTTDEDVAIPYTVYTGNWSGLQSCISQVGPDETSLVPSSLELHFQRSHSQVINMLFHGFGEDENGSFEILNGSWLANGRISFLKYYDEDDDLNSLFQGVMIPAGICGVSINLEDDISIMWLWRPDLQTVFTDG